MAKVYEHCPGCGLKGVYQVFGYDPEPAAGPWYRCRYCQHSERRPQETITPGRAQHAIDVGSAAHPTPTPDTTRTPDTEEGL